MDYRLLLAGTLIFSTPLWAKDDTAPAADRSAGAPLTIDSWKPAGDTVLPVPPPVPIVTSTSQRHSKSTHPTDSSSKKAVVNPPPAGSPVRKAAVEPPAPLATRVTLNEMTGEFSSLDTDAHTIRLSVEGGYTPQFDYDDKTSVLANGQALKVEDLQRGDPVVIRYVGKDLTARQIEKLSHPPSKHRP